MRGVHVELVHGCVAHVVRVVHGWVSEHGWWVAWMLGVHGTVWWVWCVVVRRE
jgi:hypothetical protein